MWQFSEAVRGLADGCQQLGIRSRWQRQLLQPDRRHADPAHPGHWRAGVIDDVTRRTRHAFHNDGAQIYCWAIRRRVRRIRVDGRRARLRRWLAAGGDLDRERALADVLIGASRDGLIESAHDLATPGGRRGRRVVPARSVGARLTVPDGTDPFVLLFSESAAGRSSPCAAATRPG